MLSVTDATLVGGKNAEKVLLRLWESAALCQKLTFDAVVKDQYAGQMVASADPWGGLIRGHITSMEWEFTNGGQTAHVTVWGSQLPAQIAQFYAGEMYAGEEVAHLCS